MALTIAERKYLMPHGRQKEIAESLGVSEAFVSNVVNAARMPRTERAWKKHRAVARVIARTLKRPMREVFPELFPARAIAAEEEDTAEPVALAS